MAKKNEVDLMAVWSFTYLGMMAFVFAYGYYHGGNAENIKPFLSALHVLNTMGVSFYFTGCITRAINSRRQNKQNDRSLTLIKNEAENEE